MPFRAGVNAKTIKQPSQARQQRSTVDDAVDAVVDVVGIPTVGNVEEVPINLERLEPVGNLWGGQVSISPNEPVSPTDCELWPDSPFCSGGSAISVSDFLDVDVQIYEGENEIVVVVDPSIAFINFPPFVAAWQKDGTTRQPVQDTTPVPEPEIEYTPIHGLKDRCAYATFASDGSWLLTVGGVTGTSTVTSAITGETKYYWHSIEFWTFPSSARQHIGFRSSRRTVGESGKKIVYEKKIGEIDFQAAQRLTGWTDTETATISRIINRSGGVRWNQIYCGNELIRGNVPLIGGGPVGKCCKDQIRSFQAQQNELDDIKKCLEEIKETLDKTSDAIGVDDFPLKNPLLTGDEDTQNNLVELIEWNTKNLDAVNGYWPLKVKILNRKGDVSEIEISDLSEAIHEIFGLLFSVAEDADAAVNISSRGVVESIQGKVATIQAGQWIDTIVKFLGYETQEKEKEIKISVSPKASGKDGVLQNQEIEEFLQPTKIKYKGVEFRGKERVLEILERILEDSEIARAALYRKFSTGPKGESSLTGEAIIRENLSGLGLSDEEWEKFMGSLRKRNVEIDEKSEGFRFE